MQRNITFDLIGHAQARPDAAALLLPQRTIGFRALDQSVWQYAAALQAQGVRAGQVVGLSFVEELGLVLALLALARLGATAYSIPRSATASQRRQMAQRAAMVWLASDQPERFESGVASLRLERQAIEASPARIDSRLLVPAPEAPWLLITGSGSTGRPKLIPVSHAQGRARSELGARALGLTASDRVAALSHFDFSTSKFRLHEALWAGAACALELWTDTATVLQRCASDRLSVLYGTVFHAEQLIAALPAGNRETPPALPMLRAFELTASTVSDDLRQRFRQRLTPQLYVRYGINEAGPVAIAGPPEVYQIAGTVGRPPAGVEIELVDRRGQALPPATVGLVRIRTPALVDGYLGDAEASRASFQDGWFLPGDLGLLTREGQLVFYGRADHMLIMNGINIYPAEIEQLMAAHPAVADVAVVPVQHRVHQDIPVCALTLRAGATVSEQALLEHASSQLGARGPYRVLIVDAIPRNHEGKLMRAELLRLIGARLLTPGAQADSQGQKPAPAASQRRQRLQSFEQRFTLPAAVDLPALDGWLMRVLQTPIEAIDPAASCSQSPPSAPQERAGQWLWRALLLARQLLQASRIPVFDPPQIISLNGPDAETGRWQARVALALVQQLPVSAYSEALTAALGLCDLAASQTLTEASLQGFYDEASRVIGRLTRLMPPGKSTLPLLQAAHDQGIPFIHLGGGVFQLGWGSKSHRIDRSATELDSAIGARLAQNKALTARLLQGAGLPAPQHQVVTDADTALATAQRLGWPVVVKPLDLDRGEGVTVDVADQAALEAAFAAVQGLSPSRQVIVERQVAGCCHRLFIARGRLLYAVKRLPMSVMADGRHPIAELVQAELEAQRRLPPWQRSKIQPLDALALSALAAAGYSADSVPPAGSRIALRRIESTAWGGVDEKVSAIVHPENLRIALEASRLFGLDIAGIDLITPDIARPWFENGAIINEVNHAPQLGGGEISRRQIPVLLDWLIEDRGRIPIEVFVGGEAAWTAASQRWQALLTDGLRAYLTGPDLTLEPSGARCQMALTGSYPRARALALSTRVDAIVMAVPVREFVAAEFPFEGLDHIGEKATLHARASGQSASPH
ncbi:MAG: AMP-binding protein [Burkholderiales bacterium]|nr:AMP-binding protein [Burkholderiales bacterium]